MFTWKELDAVATKFALQKVFAVSTRYEGNVRGVHVSIDGASVGNAARVWVAATAPNGSDVALDVQRVGLFSSGERLLTSDAAFDGLFLLRCVPDDAQTALALVDATARASLVRLARVTTPTLSDGGLRCECSVYVETDELAYVVEAAVELVRAFEANLARCPPPARMRVDDAAGAFLSEARALGLDARSHPLSARGELGGSSLDLRFRTQFGKRLSEDAISVLIPGLGFGAVLRFPEPLGAGLRLRSATWVDRAQSSLGFKDLQVNDAAFDQAWRIDARDEKRARALLGGSARTLISAMKAAGFELAVTDDGANVCGPLPRSGAQAVQILSLLGALRAALMDDGSRGVYR